MIRRSLYQLEPYHCAIVFFGKTFLRRLYGDRTLLPVPEWFPMREQFRIGDVVVRGRPDIVSRVVRVLRTGRLVTEDLYLSPRFATRSTNDPEGYRLATPADHKRAQRYAARHNGNL